MSLKIFGGYGIELEYMIVDKDSLSILPVTDKVIFEQTGEYVSDVVMGEMGWSNELALHVIELKTKGPAKDLSKLPGLFHENILHINKILEKFNGRIMPAAMHPWMDPFKEMKLWPHDNSPVYDAYNKIFDCKGHGWCNLQSMHINLPFSGDEEFGRLHAAIRLVLPLLPALAASSPIVERSIPGPLDYRLEVYKKNQAKVPAIAGKIIPEAVFSGDDYNERIFQPLYKDISVHDPEGILQEEWLNSRGAIARFDRNAIEIRLIDMQECPLADLSIAAFVIEIIKAMVNEKWSSYYEQRTFHEDALASILLSNIKTAENTLINDRKFLKAFGFSKDKCSASDLLKFLYEKLMKKSDNDWAEESLNNILNKGTLSTRILKALNYNTSNGSLKKVYEELCNCCEKNKQFVNE